MKHKKYKKKPLTEKKITIKRQQDQEKPVVEPIDNIKQKIIANLNTKELTIANTLLDELRQSYAETPHLIAESLSNIAQELTDNKRKLALLEEAFELNPENPTILNRHNCALAEIKSEVEKAEIEKAFEPFERALQIKPDDIGTLKKYRKLLVHHGQDNKVFEIFERALQVSPDNVEILSSYGVTLACGYQQFEKAFEIFERALKIESNNNTVLKKYRKTLKCLTSYGKALADKGEFEKAFAMFERSLQVDASNTVALNSYGKALADKGEFEKAFDMFERSLQVDANNTIALTSYGKALADKGEFEKAFAMFESSLQVNANNTIALNSYGKALADKGEFEKAFAMFERSLQVDAKDTTALNSYGKALADKGEFEKAFAMFESSLQVDAKDTTALNSYGYALAANNDFQKASEQFEKSLQAKPDDHITLFMYATVLEAAREYKEAITCIEKIRLADISSDRANFLGLKLGQLYYLTKQETRGKKCFDRVIKNTRDADIGRLQAAKHILAIQPYSKEAIDLLTEIIENSPNHTQALKMFSLESDPENYFERFKTSAENSLKDTEMLNRAMYHKILNEISMLKAIAYQIVEDERASEVLAKVITSIESTYEKITQLRNEEKIKEEEIKVEPMSVNQYEEIVTLISQTAHNVADIVNNELAIIKRRLQRVVKNLTEKDRFFNKVEKLLQRIETTETALNDLKAINEGINLHDNTFQIKTLFEPWQTTSKLQHATLVFDIQNGDSEFVGDQEKIKSFLSELIENALKHNPNQADFQITISSKDMQNLPHLKSRNKRFRVKTKKYLVITVNDNGKGIPTEKKYSIFLPLETTSKEGSGLGLFLIKRTLEKMKGHITETGTQGARFEIDIPFVC